MWVRFFVDTTKRFVHIKDFREEEADLVLSLDVIYHLVEDDVFESHMDPLFSNALRYVVIFSTNHDDEEGLSVKHVRNRKFTDFCEKRYPEFELIIKPDFDSSPSKPEADFYVFQRRD